MEEKYKYKAIFRKDVLKFLNKHKGESFIDDFHKSVRILRKDPYENSLDIKSMKGLELSYRLRISKYRFVYDVMDEELIIYFVKADKRGDIY